MRSEEKKKVRIRDGRIDLTKGGKGGKTAVTIVKLHGEFT